MPNASHPLYLAALLLTAAEASTAQVLLHEVAPPGFEGPVTAVFDLDQDGHDDFIYDGHVFSGADASILLDLKAATGTFNFDADVVADLGISRDGVVDFVLVPLSTPQLPRIYAVSGADGSVLVNKVYGNSSEYASFVSGVGDADGDGFEDVVVGTRFFEGPCQYEMARVAFISGAGEGFNPWYFNPSFPTGSYSWALPLGDLNDDGKSNFAVRGSCGLGQYVYEANTGGPYQQLFSLNSGYTSLYTRATIATVGDVNGNGRPDYATLNTTLTDPLRVLVYDGGTRQVLLTLPDAGSRVGGPGDVNCDGIPDILTTSPFTAGAETRLYSGADGSILWVAPVVAHTVHEVGDVDGDGRPDMGLDLGSSMQIWSAVGLGGRPCKQKRVSGGPRGPITR